MATQTDMRSLINKIVEAASSNKLTTEFVTQHFNSKGFTAFEADGEKWYPKSASSKAGKNGTPVLSLSWTTFDGKNFDDAAYKFARVYVNPETNEVLKAQLAGTKDQVAGRNTSVEFLEQLEATIRAALNKDPEIKKMRDEVMRTSDRSNASPWRQPWLYQVSEKDTTASYAIDSPAGFMDYDGTPGLEEYLDRSIEVIKNAVPGIIKIKPDLKKPQDVLIRFVVQK